MLEDPEKTDRLGVTLLSAGNDRALPTCAFMFADRMVCFDHATGTAYAMCYCAADGEDSEAHAWLDSVCAVLESIRSAEPMGDTWQCRCAFCDPRASVCACIRSCIRMCVCACPLLFPFTQVACLHVFSAALLRGHVHGVAPITQRRDAIFGITHT